MKIRNKVEREYFFYPAKDSKLNKISKPISFKYKQDLMKFLNANLLEALNGSVSLSDSRISGSMTIRSWNVWFNEKQNAAGIRPDIQLRNCVYKKRKDVSKPWKISKESKKYGAFTDKVISLMTYIGHNPDNITKSNAKNLVSLFYKRGFKDFEPDEGEKLYIENWIKDGIDFCWWSDRCNFLRAKTIIEYFKLKELI